MGKSQRTKGASGERELCALLSTGLDRIVKRNIGQSRDGGDDITLPPFRIEVKRRKSLKTLYGWVAQVVAACRGTEDRPVVALREDNGEWLVMLRLADFIALAKDKLA